MAAFTLLLAGVICAAIAWAFAASPGAIGMSFFAGMFIGICLLRIARPYDYEGHGE